MKREAAMGILHDMLFSNSGPLYNALYEEGLVAPNLSYGYSRTGQLAFQALAGESDDPDRVFAWLRTELKRRQSWLDKDPERALAREDFERCKRVAFAEYVKDFDSTEDIANNLLTFHFEGYELFSYAEVLSDVTYEDVCDALRDFWADERAALSVIVPDGSASCEP
jgi:predicted Zn-dependent peptidase